MNHFIRTMAVSIAMGASVCTAQITGTVKLVGDAPKPVEIDLSGMPDCKALHPDPIYDPAVIVGEKNELANVVITIKPIAKGVALPPGDVPKAPAVLGQKGCEYVPHILVVRVGQPIEVRNDDAFMHNVHALPAENPEIKLIEADKDPGTKVDAPTAVETYRVKCDVHPWMSAYIVAIDTQFVAVTDTAGKFTLPDSLPDGDYTLDAWQEKFGSQQFKVTVKDGKGSIDIAFKQDISLIPNPSAIQIALASCCQ